MTLNKAFALRLKELLIKYEISKYRLEKESGLSHSTLRHIFNGTYKDVQFSTIVKVALVFKLSLSEFFNADLFDLSNLEVE